MAIAKQFEIQYKLLICWVYVSPICRKYRNRECRMVFCIELHEIHSEIEEKKFNLIEINLMAISFLL